MLTLPLGRTALRTTTPACLGGSAATNVLKYDISNINYCTSMMTNPIGSVLQQTSGVVGKDNCVELMVPVQVTSTANIDALYRGLVFL